ncbi:MAG: VOC family protein, partial [Planctomycetes bacterium]|nr:VOC family protein [Planctomycetota bacterium]
MQVRQLDHLNLSVADFERTAQWYGRVFGFAVVEQGVRDGRRWGVLRAGDALLCVYEHPELKFADSEQLAERGFHGLAHLGLRITDRAAWLRTLETEKLEHLYWRYPHSETWYVTDHTGWEIEVALWDN